MATITLFALKKNMHGSWQLDLGHDTVRLIDPHGNVAASFPGETAERRILLPSFTQSRSNISIRTDDDKWVDFEPVKPAIADIKSNLNRAVAARGPEAIRALKYAGLRDLAIGAVATTAGIGLTVGTLMKFVVDSQGRGRSKVGLVIFGLIATGRGIYNLRRARKIQSDGNMGTPQLTA